MSNLVMPKADGTEVVFNLVISYFYNQRNPIALGTFAAEIESELSQVTSVGNHEQRIKKAELPRYFGMLYADPNNRKFTSITERGRRYYESSRLERIEIIMDAIQNDAFGRNNNGVPSSDSDIEPPKLFLKSIVDLNGVTKHEFGCILYLMHNKSYSYIDALRQIEECRRLNNLDTLITEIRNHNLYNKYFDPKFAIFLENIGLVVHQNDKFVLSLYTVNNYGTAISELNVLNVTSEITYQMNGESTYANDLDGEIEGDGISEQERNETIQSRQSESTRFSLTAATPETIASVNSSNDDIDSFVEEERTIIDLTEAIATRKERSNRHNSFVQKFAALIYRQGFELNRGNIDCLGIKLGVPAILAEVKTLDGTEKDERDQIMKAFSQLYYYEMFAMGIYEHYEAQKVAIFEKKVSSNHIKFLEENNIIVLWVDDDGDFCGSEESISFFNKINLELI